MIPIHTKTHLEIIRAEWEREFEKASLRRLARESQRSRTSRSDGNWLSKVLSTIWGELHSNSSRPMLQEPVEVPRVDR